MSNLSEIRKLRQEIAQLREEVRQLAARPVGVQVIPVWVPTLPPVWPSPYTPYDPLRPYCAPPAVTSPHTGPDVLSSPGPRAGYAAGLDLAKPGCDHGVFWDRSALAGGCQPACSTFTVP
jgi:hypothetical protein